MSDIVQRGLYLEEFVVGATYRHTPGRTVSEADNVLFSSLTMNTQALHLDAAFSATQPFGQRLFRHRLGGGEDQRLGHARRFGQRHARRRIVADRVAAVRRVERFVQHLVEIADAERVATLVDLIRHCALSPSLSAPVVARPASRIISGANGRSCLISITPSRTISRLAANALAIAVVRSRGDGT